MMKTRLFILGPIRENCYFFYDEDTLEGIVIDPGAEAEELIDFIEKEKLIIKGIFLTHGHGDHMGAVPELRQHIGCKVFAGLHEKIMLANADINHSEVYAGKGIELTADVYFKDDEEIAVANEIIRVIETPGHSPGGVCYYAEASKVLFSGDTLFFEDIGRYDLALGSEQDLFDSIKNKLFALPDDVTVYPGHGIKTTIFHEKTFNPYMNNSPSGEF